MEQKLNDQKTFLSLLTDFQLLKMKFLFVSLFSVISTQNPRLKISIYGTLSNASDWLEVMWPEINSSTTVIVCLS